jgi:pimeloyl-ACP methyl ester carboxylesterase
MSANTMRQPVTIEAPTRAGPAPPRVEARSRAGGSGIAMSMRELELPNGVRLPFVEQGERSGVPVLLLHGYTDSWRSFEGVLAHLPNSVHACALTFRGHGNAERPLEGYRTADFARDVAAFMDGLDLGQAVIVGHSMGSYVAQRFAIEHPERTLGLVLMGSFPTMRGNPVISALGESVSELVDPIDRDFALDFQLSTLARPVPPALLETVVQESLKVPARIWKAALRGPLQDDHAADLGRIRAPTLIVWGDRDAIFGRRDQDTLAAAIPGARLLVYPGAGHAFHWEAPECFAADLVAFVESVAS